MTDDIMDEPLIVRGRYRLPDPNTGEMKSWTRVSNFAKTIADSYALNQWQQRMVIKGLSTRPDLIKRASGLDVKQDSTVLNNIAEQAKNAAGHKDAAQSGTDIHSFAENLDAGGIALADVPSAHRPTIDAYAREMQRAGLKVLPELQEVIVCVPEYGVAGRLDKIVREADGTYAVGDVKSGKITYDQMEIEVQLALYTHGFNGSGVYDLSSRMWIDPGIKVRDDYAIVIHTPVGEDVCNLMRASVESGWETSRLCNEVRAERRRKKRFVPYEPPVALSWGDRFSAVRSRADASSLYREALAEVGPGGVLDELVRLGKEALKEV